MFTIDDITQGDKLTRKIVIQSENPSYNEKTIEYRALNGDEFRNAMRKAGLTADQNAADSFEFMMAASEIGVLNPGVGKKIREIRDIKVITQIGEAIFSVSKPDEKKVSSFPEDQ